MNNLALKQMHMQDISDVLTAARLCLADKFNATDGEVFRASFGGLFAGVAADFGDKLNAYDQHTHEVPQVLALLAEEMHSRLGDAPYRSEKPVAPGKTSLGSARSESGPLLGYVAAPCFSSF